MKKLRSRHVTTQEQKQPEILLERDDIITLNDTTSSSGQTNDKNLERSTSLFLSQNKIEKVTQTIPDLSVKLRIKRKEDISSHDGDKLGLPEKKVKTLVDYSDDE